MSSTCQPDSSWNACDTWHVAKNVNTCNNMTTSHGPYKSVESCQVNSASCSNGNNGLYARWAPTQFIKQGKWAKGAKASPYPNKLKESYGFYNTQICEQVPRGTPGSFVGVHGCIAANSPFVDQMNNVF